MLILGEERISLRFPLRLEKGYRAFGMELESEYNPVEAGLARPRVKRHDFIGKAAYLQARERAPAATLCTLTVDDHTSSTGEPRALGQWVSVIRSVTRPSRSRASTSTRSWREARSRSATASCASG